MCWNKGDSGSPFNRKIMANDRMYIRCKGCGDLHYLAKCYDDGYFTTHEGEELRQGLDDFFDRHKWCYRDKYYGGFELVYESDEDAENEDEDERIRKALIKLMTVAGENYVMSATGFEKEQFLAYLEKQKERVPENEETGTRKEQKQEWSEEDEEMIKTIISVLERSSQVTTYEQRGGLMSGSVGCSDKYKEEIAWLKSLRPDSYKNCNSRWKPSEEQMAALEAATVRYQSTGLESLYEELKKL